MKSRGLGGVAQLVGNDQGVGASIPFLLLQINPFLLREN